MWGMCQGLPGRGAGVRGPPGQIPLGIKGAGVCVRGYRGRGPSIAGARMGDERTNSKGVRR